MVNLDAFLSTSIGEQPDCRLAKCDIPHAFSRLHLVPLEAQKTFVREHSAAREHSPLPHCLGPQTDRGCRCQHNHAARASAEWTYSSKQKFILERYPHHASA